MDATIIMIHCLKQNKVFGARTERRSDGDWWRTWAFPISERIAKAEGYDKTPVRGNLYSTIDDPGCPYCGGNGFVQCNRCHKQLAGTEKRRWFVHGATTTWAI